MRKPRNGLKVKYLIKAFPLDIGVAQQLHLLLAQTMLLTLASCLGPDRDGSAD